MGFTFKKSNPNLTKVNDPGDYRAFFFFFSFNLYWFFSPTEFNKDRLYSDS